MAKIMMRTSFSRSKGTKFSLFRAVTLKKKQLKIIWNESFLYLLAWELNLKKNVKKEC